MEFEKFSIAVSRMEKQKLLLKNFLRYASLSILTLQTTMTVLTMRYSRKGADGDKDLYIGSTMILVSEIVKFVLCFLVLLFQKAGSLGQTVNTFFSEVLKKPTETAKLSIPSTLYTIQNNLIILALSNLDAATFQITYQLKILTTAFFSVLLLRKDIKFAQWLALVILMFGVVFVQMPSGQKESNSPMTAHKLIGLIAVLASSLSSGFAGVYYEKLLKESSQPSVIIRNLQLGIFSIIFAAAGVVISDWDKVVKFGFFNNYKAIVWVVVMLQATGGLLVAAVIKYADNILKGFATSVSIILSCLVSYIAFNDLQIQPAFILGTTMVIGATFLYGIQSHTSSTASGSPELSIKED